jgi:hypothetical protein
VLTVAYQLQSATPTINEPGRTSATPLTVTLATTTAGGRFTTPSTARRPARRHTPEATGLAADARWNFVVTPVNSERQLFGAGPVGPACRSPVRHR